MSAKMRQMAAASAPTPSPQPVVQPGKPKQEGLKTRESNLTKKPGKIVIDMRISRRTPQQMEQAQEEAAEAKRLRDLKRKKTTEKVANVEDMQARQDLERARPTRQQKTGKFQPPIPLPSREIAPSSNDGQASSAEIDMEEPVSREAETAQVAIHMDINTPEEQGGWDGTHIFTVYWKKSDIFSADAPMELDVVHGQDTDDDESGSEFKANSTSSDEDMEDHADVEDQDLDEKPAPKAPKFKLTGEKKKDKGSRLDIDTAWITKTAVGTPVIKHAKPATDDEQEKPPKAKKSKPDQSNTQGQTGTKPSKKSKTNKRDVDTGLTKDWIKKDNKSGQQKAHGRQVSRYTAGETTDPSTDDVDDHIVRYGGLGEDEEDVNVERDSLPEEKATANKGAGGLQFKASVNVSKASIVTYKKPKTQKEEHGGDKNWKITHIPAKDRDLYASEIVPWALKLSAQGLPWGMLPVDGMQKIITEVLKCEPKGDYKVEPDKAFYGLTGYKVNALRNTIGKSRMESIEAMVSALKEMHSTADRAEWVCQQLEFDADEMSARFMYARTWEKEAGWGRLGLFQNPLITRTLAFTLPAAGIELNKLATLRPVGIMILSMQAVQCGLMFYSTGNYAVPVGPTRAATFFSSENWYKKDGQPYADKWIPTVKNLKEHHWKAITDESDEEPTPSEEPAQTEALNSDSDHSQGHSQGSEALTGPIKEVDGVDAEGADECKIFLPLSSSWWTLYIPPVGFVLGLSAMEFLQYSLRMDAFMICLARDISRPLHISVRLLTVATRASVRLNPTADADNPRASSSNSTTSGGQALGSNPSYTFGSIPSNNQNFVTPVNGPVRVASSILSSLNTLTPSPVSIPVTRSPFMTPTTLTGDPGFTNDREGNGLDNNTNQYTFIPGLGFMYRAEGQEPPTTITETDFPNVIQSNIVNEGNDRPETSSAQMSERERALRRAEKSKHHGAASVGEDDIETPEIQQAILDNLPLKDPDPIPSTGEESRSFLPTAASTELNTLFNRAVNLITSSLGPSVGQPQTDAIANTAGNHFAANLQSAVARLMSPRRENETDEQYASRINAQFRFVNGNANGPYQEEHSNSESRSNVHFSPSTSGGSVIRDTDHRRDARDRNTNGSQRPDHSRNSRTNSIEHIEDPVARANREFKDRVAVQRMRNTDMRQSGQSPYPDQNISFDDAGNPFNRNNLPVQPTMGSYTQNPNTGRALGPHELERNGTGNIRYDQHTEGGTNTIHTFDYRVPQYPPITEISETNSSEMTDFHRYKGDLSDYTEPSDEYSSDSNSETSSKPSHDDKKRDKHREKRRRRNEKEKSLRKEWKQMGSGGSDDSGDGSGTEESSSDTSTYSSSSTSTAQRERN
ncbi:hypothetical protein C8J56DRAFT_881715 [Mycena floridula]|nr:hypothetical protein C8J56DRAFT_881715 [Mycena floridula]